MGSLPVQLRHIRQRLSVLAALVLLLAACSLADLPSPARQEPGGAAPPVQATALPGLPPFATQAGGQPAAPQAGGDLPSQSPPAPSPSPEPTATPTPARAQLRQLTSGGCCVGPAWSPDGSRVLFIDKPSPDAPAGLWGVAASGGSPEFFTGRLGLYSPDMQLLAFPQGGQTVVERLADGQQWTIPSEGRQVSFSPDGAWVAWTTGQGGGPNDREARFVWVSRSDGTEAREVIGLYGGGFSAWFPDGRLLVSGRLNPEEEAQAYYAVSLTGGEPLELARGERLRGGLLSPGGTWLVYLVAFSAQAEENGLWLVNTAGGERRRLDLFGAYRWRDDARLLIVPLDLNQPNHHLLQIEAAGGEARPLTDPLVEPFKIANGDWAVSPGGQAVVFVSAAGGNLWLIELPE